MRHTAGMTPERWSRVKGLFGDALPLDAEARRRMLDGACRGDEPLRAEVESLLAAHDAAGSFIERPPMPAHESAPSAPLDGRTIGPYRIERALGQGGMGAVYLASRADDAFRKHVALKIIKRGMDTDEVIGRFRRERQTLANLDHPNIARLLDGGTTDDGLPYFVMEYVEGEPLDDYCRTHALSTVDRLNLFRTVCGAVQFAHGKLVVHRDLKPDNIIVTPDGVPKLLDFGIVKLLSVDDTTGTVADTRPAARLMTLDYASPEQLRGEPISTATDVFALGVMLYELVAGAHPFRRDGRSAREVENAICEEDPARPGKGEVDLVVMQAIRKEPSRRYQSASELDDDLRRHLAGLPITAHADSAAYRTSKFVRRHAAAVAASAVLLLSLIAGIIAVSWQARVAEAERDRARVEADKAERVAAVLEQMLRAADPSVDGREVTVASVLAEASRRAGVELADQPDVRAAVRSAIGNTYYSLSLNDEAVAELADAVAIREALDGPDALSTGDVRNSLAYAYLDMREPGRAEPLFAETLSRLERLAAAASAQDDGTVRWRAVNGLGLIAARSGRRDDANRHYTEALAIARRLFGDTDQRVAEITNNLAIQALERADNAEAERLLREALRIMSALQADRTPGYAAGLSNLGSALHSLGRLAEARTHYEQAMQLRIELFGANSPEVAFTEYRLATLLNDIADHTGALALTNRILARRSSMPPRHPMIAASLSARGDARMSLGDFRGAEPDLREALALRASSLPPGHRLTASSESQLGACLTALGRASEGEPLLVSGYEKLLAGAGAAHENTILARTRLAKFYEATGRPELAAALAPSLPGG